MGLLPRGDRPPAHVRARVRGRVLAAAATAEGSWLAGTREALHVLDAASDAGANADADADAPPGPGAGAGAQVFPWEWVQRAEWDAETSTLTWQRVQDFGEPVEVHRAALPEPGSLLVLVRERVGASVVVQQRVELLDRPGGLRVVGRRSPTGAGEVVWAFELDDGVDPRDPEVAAAAERALRAVQESVGM